MEEINFTPVWVRRLLWDLIPHALVEEHIAHMGLLPASEDGHEMEHQESHKRLERLAPIAQILTETTRLAGGVLGRAILEEKGIQDTKVREDAMVAYTSAVHAGTVAVMSTLLDEGLIEITEKK